MIQLGSVCTLQNTAVCQIAILIFQFMLLLLSCSEEFQGIIFFFLYLTNTETKKDVNVISSD